MKLSEIKGKKAIIAFADLITPFSELLSDEEIVKGIQGDASKLIVIQTALRKHPDSFLEIMAILDEADVDSYEPSLVEIPAKILELITDEALIALFTSQGQNEDENVSGSAMANIEEKGN